MHARPLSFSYTCVYMIDRNASLAIFKNSNNVLDTYSSVLPPRLIGLKWCLLIHPKIVSLMPVTLWTWYDFHLKILNWSKNAYWMRECCICISSSIDYPTYVKQLGLSWILGPQGLRIGRGNTWQRVRYNEAAHGPLIDISMPKAGMVIPSL